ARADRNVDPFTREANRDAAADALAAAGHQRGLAVEPEIHGTPPGKFVCTRTMLGGFPVSGKHACVTRMERSEIRALFPRYVFRTAFAASPKASIDTSSASRQARMRHGQLSSPS